MCDLSTISPSINGFALNSVSRIAGVGSGTGLTGCQIDTIDHSEVELRQFKEPNALMDGMDVGGVWIGGRRIVMTGTLYALSRSAAFSAVASFEAAMLPTSGTYGYTSLVLGEGTLSVMPERLRIVYTRDMFGGEATDALAIPWTATFYAKNGRF